MRTVPLGSTGLTTTSLGYGCSGLMHPATAKERLALLATAFEAGIRHFDVARYYGHGGAENILGEFLSAGGRRDQATITTKFGVEPSLVGQSKGGRKLISLAQRLASIHPAVRRVLAARANRAVRAGCFDVDCARRSLEHSLFELRTDHIDLLLLHEAALDDTRTEGLYDFLEEAVRVGKIHAYGLGSDYSKVPAVLAQAPAFARVMQIANGIGQHNLPRLPPDPARALLTHSALKPLPALAAAFAEVPAEPAGAWPPVEWLRGPELAGLLLGLSLHENSQGVTLFSSLKTERIRQNVDAAFPHRDVTNSQWAAFRQLADQTLARAKHVH